MLGTNMPAAVPFETDAMYVARIRAEMNAHYRRQYGEESIPRIPWNEPPPPSAPDILSDYQSSPVQPDNRSKESDYDNEM